MAFLGELNRSETIRFYLTLDAAPTGTPQVGIDKQGAEALAETNMNGAGLEWYYDYTTDAAALAGAYQVKYSATVDGVARSAFDHYNVTVSGMDDIQSSVDILTGGAGAYNVTIHCKDSSNADIAGAKISVHNSGNDDSPLIATGTTDTSGNATVNLDAGTYTVRAYKAGQVFANITPTISASGSEEMTGVGVIITPPSDPELCRLHLFPITLDNQDVTGLTINITSAEKLTKVNGEFIKNGVGTFTYDSATTPDSYYFDAVQGTVARVTCDELGLDHEVTVPAESTKDLSGLVS